MKTHLPGTSPGRTLCGKPLAMRRGAKPLTLIDRNALVDSATCRSCQRADDSQSLASYQRECKAAGIEP